MKPHLPFVRLAIVFAYLTSLLAFGPQVVAQPAPAVPTSPPAAVLAAVPGEVTFMRDLFGSSQIAPGDTWLIGGGYLYWAQCTSGPNIAPQSTQAQPEAAATGYLRRWPIHGGAITTLSNSAFCNTASWAADDSGLYYQDGSLIYRRSLADPFTSVAVVSTGGGFVSRPLVLNGANLFYIIDNYIYSTPKAQIYSDDPQDQDGTLPVVDGGANATGLIVNGNVLNWFGGGRVRSVDKTCTVVCTANDLATEPGAYLSNASIANFGGFSISRNPLWVAGPITDGAYPLAGNQIRSYGCRSTNTGISCGAGTAYTAPNQDNSDGTHIPRAIGPMASDGNYLFWVEDLKICTTDRFGITSCAAGSVGRLMKYHIGRSPIGSPPDDFDTPKSIASQNSSGVFSMSGTPPVAVTDGWVYFDTSNGLSRIRADAPPLSWDLAFKNWEITQGVQNLNNDVPLVANKPTYVRVYGSKSSGPSAFNVEAILSGTAGNGAALGALRSINGPQNFVANDGAPNRAATNGGWLFQLPDSYTSAGVTKLTVQIDPRGVWNDPNRGNNNASNQPFNFTHKAPVCIVTIPVRTHGPVADNNSPNLFFASDMLKRLWPVSDVWLFHQDDDIAKLKLRFGIPPWEYVPYSIPDNTTRMLTSLTERDLFSDDPDQCDDANARTHYVGIVSPQTNTGDDNPDFGTNGSGRVGYDQAWVKLPADGYATGDWQAVRAGTLAHELGHNYERKHVNCGGPDDPDGGYPYKDADGQSCTIDNRDQAQPTTYFGFNPATQSPIKPTDAIDLLAYGRNRWISNYTFGGLFGSIASNSARSTVVPSTQTTRAPQLAAATGAVLVTGAISSTIGQGELNYGWVYPTAALSRKMIGKWQTYAAPTAAQSRTQAAGAYHLRLLDAGGTVLDDRAVTLVESDLHGDQTAAIDQHAVQTFALTFPAPAGQVARMELLQASTLLASLAPGSAAPTVSIISPAGGETVDTSMTLSWRASDADASDRLLFSVQYSPDNGQHWRALLNSFPNRSGTDTVTLNLGDLSGIPASTTGGLIRVAASDGYNTTISVSQPFTVVNRAPAPHIDAPGSTPLPAGRTIVVQGSATDVEDGGLSGAALRWAIDGTVLGSGQAQTIEGLAPGSHSLTLTARDSVGKEATATQTLVVAPLAIPKTGAPAFDGDCNDDAYTNAARTPLAPYADGTQAFVTLVRTDDALYACFSGMKRTAGTLAVVRVDGDHGRRTVPGANDHIFYTDEAGVLATFNGNDTGYVRGSGGAGAQISANSASWNAELRIDAGAIGGMNHVIGLGVEQALVNSTSDRYAWPQGDGASNPSSWGAASLGDVAQLSAVAPASAPVGTGDTVVTITGSGFAAGAIATLGGSALATTVISTTQLQATVPAANLAAAGMFNLTVANPGLEAAPSNALPFSVTNPLPRITQAALSGKTLALTGSSFAAGATVQFNGVDYPATGSGTQLSITVSDADLVGNANAPVTVFNPGPGGGVSNVVTLGAAPAPGGSRVYLPLLTRK